MYKKKPSDILRTHVKCSHLTIVAALTTSCFVRGEIESELDALVISAMRMPAEPSKVTSAVTILNPRELEERGIFDLRDALNEAPGVTATSLSGGFGGAGSLFMRGTTTSYSQMVVDGIRISDSTAPLGNFMAGTRLDDIGRIEVLRGPQSAIHGGDAVGGVIWLETARGQTDPTLRARAEAGSFDYHYEHLSHSGRSGDVSWFAGFGHGGQHDPANRHNYDQSRAAMRLEWDATECLTLGTTFRATDSRFDYTFFGPNADHVDATLGTIYANMELRPGWTANITAGLYQESYDNDGPFGNFGTDLERTVVNMSHAIELNDQWTILTGGFFEHTDFANTFGVDRATNRYGFHLGGQWQPVQPVILDAIIRWEDDEGFGEEVTWRAGASWEVIEGTRLRSAVGRAFRMPTLLDLFGSPFGAGNPNLSPEESIGWDVGIEQKIFDTHWISMTWFENSIENRIASFPPPPVNQPGDTPTRGLETALAGEWCDGMYAYRLAWTYLDESLQDQPDHVATASFDWRPIDPLLLGIGATYVDERSYGGAPLDDYLLLRLYGRYQINEHLAFTGRIENLTDTQYQLSNFGFGSPIINGTGIGGFVGVEVEF